MNTDEPTARVEFIPSKDSDDARRDEHNARAQAEVDAMAVRKKELEAELPGSPPYRAKAIWAELREIREKTLKLQQDMLVEVIARLEKYAGAGKPAAQAPRPPLPAPESR